MNSDVIEAGNTIDVGGNAINILLLNKIEERWPAFQARSQTDMHSRTVLQAGCSEVVELTAPLKLVGRHSMWP